MWRRPLLYQSQLYHYIVLQDRGHWWPSHLRHHIGHAELPPLTMLGCDHCGFECQICPDYDSCQHYACAGGFLQSDKLLRFESLWTCLPHQAVTQSSLIPNSCTHSYRIGRTGIQRDIPYPKNLADFGFSSRHGYPYPNNLADFGVRC